MTDNPTKPQSFEKALALDPDLALARWGVAYAIGPNYNKAWDAFDPVDLAVAARRGDQPVAGVGGHRRQVLVAHDLADADDCEIDR